MWTNTYHQQLVRAPSEHPASMAAQKRALDSQLASASKRARSGEEEVRVIKSFVHNLSMSLSYTISQNLRTSNKSNMRLQL